MDKGTLWTAKLAAWLHDPAEKALVLLRDPAGHEGGTVRMLREKYLGNKLNPSITAAVRAADHWASAADRPQFPQDANRRYPEWARVDFASDPEVIHPLSGARINLREKLTDISPDAIKAISLDHYTMILDDLGSDATDQQRQLALWRFGPERPAPDIGGIWNLLPADTRVPDHTIWAHLDLVSAFAGAFVAGGPSGRPALLSISFGPVQGFITSGRTTSDLWAGSHLLSCIAWEGMRVIAEECGPDSILLPQLRGVPLVDLWLQQSCGLPRSLFRDAEWCKGTTNHNPLFTAALPNRFIALVPACWTQRLVEDVTDRVRNWILNEAEEMLRMVFEKTKQPIDPHAHCWGQLREQLRDFPEVHWASAPWPVDRDAKKAKEAEDSLKHSLAVFYPESDNLPGLLGEEVWKVIKNEEVIKNEMELAGAKFYDSNPGVLYATVFDILDRSGAAFRTMRPFSQLEQSGYRDSLSGEAEWLCVHPDELQLPPRARKETLWTKVADRQQAWARRGEHLSTGSMLKRLWPSRFMRWLQIQKMGAFDDNPPQRYVVATQTMALAPILEILIKQLDKQYLSDAHQALLQMINDRKDLQPAALPFRLARKLGKLDGDAKRLIERLPALLEAVSDGEADTTIKDRDRIEALIEKATGSRPAAYYGLIQLDGDMMGAWLAASPAPVAKNGNLEETAVCTSTPNRLKFRETWRTKIFEGTRQFWETSSALRSYLESERPASPARHAAISEALNGYSLHLVRYVVEDLCNGMVIYAGGDDVLAMISVDDLPVGLELLRTAYSGHPPDGAPRTADSELDAKNGFVRVQKGTSRERLLRVMGERATASAGAVIAHYSSPLGMVLRTLRDAEKEAKSTGRDRFSLRIMKRSGSEIRLTAPWSLKAPVAEGNTPLGILLRLRDHLARGDISRRTAYVASSWLHRLPELDNDRDLKQLLQAHLAGILRTREKPTEGQKLEAETDLDQLAADIAALAVALGRTRKQRIGEPAPILAWLHDFISAAEFLARSAHAATRTPTDWPSEKIHA